MNIFQKLFGKKPKPSVVFDLSDINLNLEQCKCYEWGENILRVFDEESNGYLVNTKTGKARMIDSYGFLKGFSDEDIDFSTIDKFPHNHNAHTRRIDYAGINRWDNCEKGIFALSWMLYPDGRYFADEDGFGMEDNDELTVYCIMNDNLEVIRPFTVVPDIRALLKELRNA